MKHLRRIAATAAAAIGLVAAMTAPANAFVWSSCNHWDSWVSGNYTVFCDEWGATSGQCLYVNSLSSWTSTSNFTGGGIKAYPNTSITANVALSSLSSATSSFGFTAPSSGAEFDVAYDFWTAGSVDEVMVWENWSSGVGPISATYGCSGTPGSACPIYTNQTIGGQTYDVYRGNFGHNTVSFLHTTKRGSGTEDILALMNWANSKGILTNATLGQIQFGVEITSTTGAQDFSLTAYSATWSTGGGIPPVPTGLAATPGSGQVALTWNASTGATAYDVKRSTVSGSGYATAASPTTTSYTNTGLTNGTTYYFVVDAKNASGTSANSTQASATPSAPSPPAAPTGLAATPGSGQVALTWNASTGATAYDVKRSTVSGSGYATVSSPTTTSYTNTGLTNGTTYFFVVDAKNAAGTSANSSQVSATPSAGTSSLKVQYKCNQTAATTQQIMPGLSIVNTGASSVALSTLKIRYYYTIDTTQPETFTCDYAGFGNANVTGTFVALSPTKPTADHYLEVGFTSAAGSVNAGANTGEIQCRFNKNDWSNFTQTNDYSFDATKTALADWTKVTLYQNGTLVWGTAP